MSMKEILAGTLFVFATASTGLVLFAIGLMWWDHFHYRKDK